jgi:hypothetical protein
MDLALLSLTCHSCPGSAGSDSQILLRLLPLGTGFEPSGPGYPPCPHGQSVKQIPQKAACRFVYQLSSGVKGLLGARDQYFRLAHWQGADVRQYLAEMQL